jgi:hypothetical protein
MGADIHWIIERQAHGGRWEAVYSKRWLIHEMDSAYINLPWDHPRMLVGDKDYTLFGILSGVRGTPSGVTQYLATEGLPDDASEHVKLAFERGGEFFDYYHSRGYFTLGHLRQVVVSKPPETVPSKEDATVLSIYAAAVEALIEGPDALDLGQILVGSPDDEPGDGVFPAMRDESNHQKVQRIARAQELLPISGDTLRMVIAYDS